MNSAVTLLLGIFILYLAVTGKAEKVWKAITS